MLNNNVVVASVIAILLLGFLVYDYGLSLDDEEPYISQIGEQKWENNSYQFWNLEPMSMGNTTVLSFNQTGEVAVTVELDVFFHEPLLREKGYINYTLINENETVFSHQLSEGDAYFEIYIFNVSNLTIQIRASGTDNSTDVKPGDWFLSRTYCEIKNEV